MTAHMDARESRVAVLVDCDNVSPEMIDLLQLAQEIGGHWTARLHQENIARMAVNPLTGKSSVARDAAQESV